MYFYISSRTTLNGTCMAKFKGVLPTKSKIYTPKRDDKPLSYASPPPPSPLGLMAPIFMGNCFSNVLSKDISTTGVTILVFFMVSSLVVV